VSSDSDNSDSVELGEVEVLELFGDSPRDEISRWSESSFEVVLVRLLRDITFITNLDSAENIRNSSLTIKRSTENEDSMSRSIREKLKIIGSVLIMRRHEESHEFVQELLRSLVVTEESISVDIVELTIIGVRSSSLKRLSLSAVETQDVVQPALDRIIRSISDRLFKLKLLELSVVGSRLSLVTSISHPVLCSQLFDEFQGK